NRRGGAIVDSNPSLLQDAHMVRFTQPASGEEAHSPARALQEVDQIQHAPRTTIAVTLGNVIGADQRSHGSHSMSAPCAGARTAKACQVLASNCAGRLGCCPRTWCQ